MRNLNVPMYDPEMVRPMREELTRLGFEELRTPAEGDAALTTERAPTPVVVNSVGGCAARHRGARAAPRRGHLGVRLRGAQRAARRRARDSTRAPARATPDGVCRSGRRRDGAGPQLLHRLPAVVAADRAVQGRQARLHARAPQHRGPPRARHCGRSDRGVRPVLLSLPLPPDLTAAIDEAWARIRSAPGFLTEREGRFLALLAACTPASSARNR